MTTKGAKMLVLRALAVAAVLAVAGCDGCSGEIGQDTPEGGRPDRGVEGGPDGGPDGASDGGGDSTVPAPPLTEDVLDSPENPAALTRTVVTDLYDATRFLWSGASPPQRGVGPTTIVREQVAVLRGRLRDRDGSAIAGVTVSVLGHPEFGETDSRTEGGYDLVVNGGQKLAVVVAKAGYLPVQRQVAVPVRDYLRLAEVRLIPQDAQGTAVAPATATDLLAARGSQVVDGDGPRQATLLFAPGTSATMRQADGSEASLPGPWTVRVTEYTVGSTGPAAMPALLPPASGYTYAVELSVDEATAAGAVSVEFDRPVVLYVDNFLGFPVGGAVPIGFYARERGLWVPTTNGRVVAVLGLDQGLATLDVDGDGTADSAATLAALGITDRERARLTELYAAGTTLWRATVTHMTPFDCNWPYGPPDDALAPLFGLGKRGRCKDPCKGCGSIIECQNQALGEEIPVVGSPVALAYRSDRTLGRRLAATVEFTLGGSTLPASLQRIDVEVTVAGRQFVTQAPATANQLATFTWDGKDGYGRLLQGAQPVLVRVGYVYPGRYQDPATSPEAFAEFSGIPMTANRTRGEVTLWAELKTWLGQWDSGGLGLGGWDLEVHHVYDPTNRVLYLGSGEQREAESLGLVSRRVAGGIIGGYLCDYAGDNGPAITAQLYTPSGLAIAPDGALLIADSANHRVRRVGRDGVITTIAGTGVDGFGGDNGPALAADLSWPSSVAAAADGSLYLADAGNNRIRRIAPDGTITTFAGSGAACGLGTDPCGDGGPALAANIYSPTWLAWSPDGSLYVVEWSSHRVRRIRPDGVIVAAVGDGQRGDGPDGWPAPQARLYFPAGMAVGPDGSLYIADHDNYRVRRVGSDGLLRTVAGITGGCTSPTDGCGDGGPAVSAGLGLPSGVAFAPDGSLHIVDAWMHCVRRVSTDGLITTVGGTGITCDVWTDPTCGDGGLGTRVTYNAPDSLAVGGDGTLYIGESTQCLVRQLVPALAGVTATDVVIPSDDGLEVYVFDSRGRHLRTLDALTGSSSWTFGYDAQGFLLSCADGDGNSISVERDGAGAPIAVVAPFGQRTTLGLDANGYLASVTTPAGETTLPAHAADGLLTALTDPRGGAHAYEYDASGRLTRDTDPSGGFQTLTRTVNATGFRVETATAEGRVSSCLLETSTTGQERRVSRFSSGVEKEEIRRTDGSRQITYPDGTTATLLEQPDPRWGLQAVQPAEMVVNTPGGLKLTLAIMSQAVLTDPANLLSLVSLTQSAQVNGRTHTSTYDAGQRLWTHSSAGGRTRQVWLDAQGRPVQEQITGLEAVRVTYDGRGRAATVATGAGALERIFTMTYGADGNLATVGDPVGGTTGYGYDTGGRMTSQTLPGGRVVALTYDGNGNVTSVTPPGRTAHAFAFTATDLEASYTPPDLGVTPATTFAYNLDGQLSQVARPDGTTVSLGYDTAGRLSGVTTPQGQLGFTYDATAGTLTRVTAADGGTLSYQYDGPLVTSMAWAGAVTGSVAVTYNDDFLPVSQTLNSGQAVQATYDEDGLLVQAGELAIARDAGNGRITGTTCGQVTTTRGINSFGELTSDQAVFGATPLLAAQFVRDKLGRITSKTETIGATTRTYSYTYDPRGPLAQVLTDGALTAKYTYDANGNRLSVTDGVTTVAATHDAQDRILTHGAATYSHTANGELLSRTRGTAVTTFAHDASGNLIGAVLPDGRQLAYVVDGLGRRIGKRIDGALVQGFLYQDGLRPVAELDSGGSVVARFVYGERGNVPSYLVKGGSTFRIIADHLGSPRLVVETTTGAIAQRLDYDAFGQIISDTSPGFQPFGFAGGLYDADTGLVRFGARDYDAETGRWTTKDPIGFGAGDANLYGYVLGDPVNLVDPSGLVLDTVLDIGFIAYDVYRIVKDNVFGNCKNLGTNLTALGLDVVGAAIPFATGLGAASRAARGGERVVSYGVCFAAGTHVDTAAGKRPIEEVVPGDLVWSRDDVTGEVALRRVDRRFATPQQEVLRLVLTDANGASEELHVTPDHPFWVEGQGWVAARNLQLGQELLSSRGSAALRVTGQTWLQDRETVYNLEVSGAHTYFVGDSGAWVHNMCAAPRRGGLQFNPQQAALVDLARDARRSGVNVRDAQTLRCWAKEYSVGYRPKLSAPSEAHPGRPFGQHPHIHVGPVSHIPVTP
jgi:RHS repeat-associated protein